MKSSILRCCTITVASILARSWIVHQLAEHFTMLEALFKVG